MAAAAGGGRGRSGCGHYDGGGVGTSLVLVFIVFGFGFALKDLVEVGDAWTKHFFLFFFSSTGYLLLSLIGIDRRVLMGPDVDFRRVGGGDRGKISKLSFNDEEGAGDFSLQ